MKIARPFALIAAAALLPLAASAQEATPEPVRAASTLERAQVRQALDDARRDGSMKVFRAGYIGEAVSSSRSRAELMAEVRQARASGELAAMNAEAVSFNAVAASRVGDRVAMGVR